MDNFIDNFLDNFIVNFIDPSGTERFNNWTTKGGLYSGKQRFRLELALLILLSTLPNVNRSSKSFYELAITHATRFALETENNVSWSQFFQIPFFARGKLRGWCGFAGKLDNKRVDELPVAIWALHVNYGCALIRRTAQ